VYRVLGDEEGVARAGGHLGIALGHLGDYESAATLLEESLTIMRARQNVHDTAMALLHLGHVVRKQGDERRAAALLEESIALLRQIGESLALARALIRRAELAQAHVDARQAAALLEESVRLCQELGDKQGQAEALHQLAHVAHTQGEDERALARCAEALGLARAVGDTYTGALIEQTMSEVVCRPGTRPADASARQGRVTADTQPTVAPALRTRLRTARQSRGLTLAAVGALFGVSHATVSQWESGPEPDARGHVRGKPIPSALRPLLERWIATGEAPTAEELAVHTRRSVRPRTPAV
jgi:tetratricopeptide (TPR) repeat protein